MDEDSEEYRDIEEYFEDDLFREKDIIEKVDYLYEEIKKIKEKLK